MRRNPHLRNRPTLELSRSGQLQSIEWLRGQGSNPDLLLQRQAWYQFHHLALGVTRASGRRDSNSQPPASEAGALPLRHVQVSCRCRTDGGSRTRTDGGLSAVPLPVGLRQQVVHGGPRGIRTRNLLLAGELRFLIAPPAQVCCSMDARAGIEPACRAYETPLHPVPSQCDRPDSNRLPPGPRPGVSTTSDLGHRRRGGTRTPGFLHVREAVCQLTYSSFVFVVRRASWSRTTSSRDISAVPSLAGSRPPRVVWRCGCGGLGSARTSPCRVSTGRSTVRASRPGCS